MQHDMIANKCLKFSYYKYGVLTTVPDTIEKKKKKKIWWGHSFWIFSFTDPPTLIFGKSEKIKEAISNLLNFFSLLLHNRFSAWKMHKRLLILYHALIICMKYTYLKIFVMMMPWIPPLTEEKWPKNCFIFVFIPSSLDWKIGKTNYIKTVA